MGIRKNYAMGLVALHLGDLILHVLTHMLNLQRQPCSVFMETVMWAKLVIFVLAGLCTGQPDKGKKDKINRIAAPQKKEKITGNSL